jgi:hypothetical protein
LVKLPISGIVLLPLIYLPFIDCSDFIIKIILIIFTAIPLFTELKYYFLYKNKHNYRNNITWSFLVIYLIIVGFILYISHSNFSQEKYIKIIDNMFSIIIPLAIFNISALFILLQMNYNKFCSTYLVKQILKSPPLLISSLFPSIIFIFNLVMVDENKKTILYHY